MAQALYRHHLFSCPHNPTCVITYKLYTVSHDTNLWEDSLSWSSQVDSKIRMGEELILQSQDCSEEGGQ